jgi:hypothetical protein
LLVFAAAVAFALFFSCHPSPKTEDLLLPLHFACFYVAVAFACFLVVIFAEGGGSAFAVAFACFYVAVAFARFLVVAEGGGSAFAVAFCTCIWD